MQSEQFAVAVGLAARVQRALSEQATNSTRRVLHGLNLPAGTDVSRILNELGQLKRQVRELSTQLDDAQAELQAARSTPAATMSAAPRKAARASPPRGSPPAQGGHPHAGSSKGRLTWPRPSPRRARRPGPQGRRAQRAARPQRAQAPRRRRPAGADADAEGDGLVGGEGRAVALHRATAALSARPLLFMHSLVSRSYVFDLVPGNSVVETMRRPRASTCTSSTGACPTSSRARNTLETYTRRLPADDRRAGRRDLPGARTSTCSATASAACCRCWPSPGTPTCPCAAWP